MNYLFVFTIIIILISSINASTFGNSFAGTLWESLGSDSKSVAQFTLTEIADVVSISAYQKGAGRSGTQKLRTVIYSDNGNQPGGLVVISNELSVSGTSTAKWVTYTLASSVRLNPGKYWLGHLVGSTNQLTKRAYSSSTVLAAWNGDSYTDGATNPFGNPEAYTSQFSIYATYTTPTTSPSPTPSPTPTQTPTPTPTPTQTTTPTPTPTQPPSVNVSNANSLGQFYLDYSEVSLITQHAGVYAWEVIQSYMRDHVNIANLKATNPKMRLFMYFETAGAYAETTDATWPSGMGYQWVKANHPEWIVKDGNGNDITFWGGSLHLYDVGNQAYQDEWATQAINYAKTGGFHGVFGDDVNMGEAFLDSWSGTSSKYPTYLSWTQAMESFLNRVSPKLRAAGIGFVPNVASQWDSDRATQVRWAQAAGGYAREHYEAWQGDTATDILGGAEWKWMAELHRDIVAAKVPFYAFPHAGKKNVNKMRYTRCSFLLWHEPSVGGAYAFSTGGGPDAGSDPYDSAWTFDLGSPSGPATQQSAGQQFNN
ncbi:hypothetical protein SAMD00019534_068210 [Acytostelium subglobosum LB1]|uniref:hypothetical protein n=1 Tax=Acytostelium subglobosum LB1 TaxID=1410327 RepID=UPI000644B8EA|nr:hypothetical protein SAMD00019534_068210 [Acytostelium subglobosum LB1]GAM23646.1 hypothetical protein SAMD00019534_068210 [Acytostelium subglobosum LB1]|eukprot:XP_012753387.1 hypothetical protein SAMD00019534_068210 [Acytostelium subglobosum LB1]